jgi:hypothetical protein
MHATTHSRMVVSLRDGELRGLPCGLSIGSSEVVNDVIMPKRTTRMLVKHVNLEASLDVRTGSMTIPRVDTKCF